MFGTVLASGGSSQGDSQGSEAAATGPDARCFIESDFNMNAKLVEEQLKLEVEKDILDLIGMEEAKVLFEQARAKVRYVEKTGDRSALKTCLNLVRRLSTGLPLPSIGPPLPFHWPSTAVHWPSTALPLPFHCRPLALNCPFTALPLPSLGPPRAL